MLRTLIDRTTTAVSHHHHHRSHRRPRRGMGAAWRAIDDDPLLLCDCSSGRPGATCAACGG